MSTEPTPTTNITGFFMSVRGLSLIEAVDDGPLQDLRLDQLALLVSHANLPASVKDLELLDDGTERQ